MGNARFTVESERCIGCGSCLDVCPGNMVGGRVLEFKDGQPVMVDQTKFGWQGCWRCMHCMTICPTGAISILGYTADELPDKPEPSIQKELPKLLAYRRSCRDFRREEVPAEIVDELLEAVSTVPTGGNNQRLEFSCVYTRDAMRRLYEAVFPNDQLSLLDEGNTDDLSALRMYDAPHLFIAHKPKGNAYVNVDDIEIGIATAYFELLANAYGLGTVITSYAAIQLSEHEEALKLLEIPEENRIVTLVAFGYPKYEYQRGIKKTRKTHKIR